MESLAGGLVDMLLRLLHSTRVLVEAEAQAAAAEATAAEEREGRALEVEEVVEPLGTDYGFSAPRSSSAPEPSGAQARSPASSVPSPLYPEPSSFSSLVH
jgi:hypothetical protein